MAVIWSRGVAHCTLDVADEEISAANDTTSRPGSYSSDGGTIQYSSGPSRGCGRIRKGWKGTSRRGRKKRR